MLLIWPEKERSRRENEMILRRFTGNESTIINSSSAPSSVQCRLLLIKDNVYTRNNKLRKKKQWLCFCNQSNHRASSRPLSSQFLAKTQKKNQLCQEVVALALRVFCCTARASVSLSLLYIYVSVLGTASLLQLQSGTIKFFRRSCCLIWSRCQLKREPLMRSLLHLTSNRCGGARQRLEKSFQSSNMAASPPWTIVYHFSNLTPPKNKYVIVVVLSQTLWLLFGQTFAIMVRKKTKQKTIPETYNERQRGRKYENLTWNLCVTLSRCHRVSWLLVKGGRLQARGGWGRQRSHEECRMNLYQPVSMLT